jgi:hypothetical protein
VTELEYQKELLQAKIDAQRTVLALELRAAHAAIDPVSAVLRLFGLDRTAVALFVPVLRAMTSHLGHSAEGEGKPPSRERSPTSEA